MSAKSVPQPRIGKGPGINFEKSNEKLNNPKETTFRILKYIGNKNLNETTGTRDAAALKRWFWPKILNGNKYLLKNDALAIW